MNKQYYSFGNPYKVKFREHYCYRCGSKLSIVKHHKVVSQKSDEAKYYDFSVGVDGGVMVGPCEFVHKVFYCQKCSQNIEFVTQINQEDIDILIKSVQKYFYNKGRNINIKKYFENINNEVVEDCTIESISNLCLLIEENDKDTLVYKISISRKKNWERPYYFKVNKKELIKFIHIMDCYKYTLERLEDLSAPYEEQVNNIEDFAFWNLPTELCDDWCNMEYFISMLYDSQKIDDNTKSILIQINENFEKCTNEDNFTHEGMKNNEFWAKQRRLASQALQLMKNNK